MSTYKLAFIGCGKRAQQHVNGVKSEPRVNVVALSDVKREAAEAMNQGAGFGATVYADYRAMLDRERPDIVIACLWTPLHLPVFRDCVAAGVKAVMSEKPMAPTWGECLEMARLAEETPCQLTFCHQRRFKKGNRLARKLIGEGRFGKIERMDLYSPPNLLDCGTHTFDQALSFNGESPAKWVLGAVDASKTLNWFNVKSEIMASGLVVFSNGVRAHFQVGDPDKDMGAGVRVIGSEGFLEVAWDGQFGKAVAYGDPSWRPPAVSETEDEAMTALVHDCVDALQGGREPELSHRKGLRASEIIFALYESVRRHARVELPLTTRDNAFLTMLEAGAFSTPA